MTLQILGLCRGNGKGYVKISVADIHNNVRASINLMDKVSLDCPVLPVGFPGEDECAQKNWGDDSRIGEREFVVVVPLLDSMKYVVRIEDNETHERIGDFSFRPLASKIQSRLTYWRRSEFAAQIRDIEQRRSSGMPQVQVIGIFPTGNGRFSCRFRVRYPYFGVNGPCTVGIYDETAHKIDAKPIMLEETLALNPHDDACQIHEAVYSVIISDANKTLCIVAKPEHQDSCFACVLPPMFDQFVQSAYRYTQHASCDESYRQWLEQHRATHADIRNQRQICQSWSDGQKPLISIVTVVFRPPVEYLQSLINSLIAQSYDNFEVIFVNVSGNDSEARAVNALLENLKDSRFHVITRENKSIADNTNAGINKTCGEYIAFVDHDDVIEPDALYRYVSSLRNNPTADVLYCDEDLLEDGQYKWPTFKPAYNPDLLNAHNYVTHMLMISRRVLEQVELSPSDVSGAQDYDLTLKCCEKARAIVNVPYMLYHWRVHHNSTSVNPDSKPYAQIAGKLALERHFKRIGLQAEIRDAELPFSYRPRYIKNAPQPKIDIVIPCWAALDTLTECLTSILAKTEYKNYEICVVARDIPQNHATHNSEVWAHDSRVRTIIYHGMEPSRASLRNYGAAHCDGDFLLFLDGGMCVDDCKWLDSMVNLFLRPDVGVVGAKLLSADGLVKHGGMWVSSDNAGFLNGLLPKSEGGYMETMRYPVDCSAVSSACLMIRRALFHDVCGFDEKLSEPLDSADLCLKIRERQYLTVFDPQVCLWYKAVECKQIMHSGYDECAWKERDYFRARWCKMLSQDCYINRNLNPYDDGHYRIA